MAIHPDMLEQTRRFHQAGKLVEAERAYQQILQANGLATNFTITYLYTAVNAIQSITYPNGTETDYAYDPLMNRLTLVTNKVTSNGTILSKYTYALNADGMRNRCHRATKGIGRFHFHHDQDLDLRQPHAADRRSGQFDHLRE